MSLDTLKLSVYLPYTRKGIQLHSHLVAKTVSNEDGKCNDYLRSVGEVCNFRCKGEGFLVTSKHSSFTSC